MEDDHANAARRIAAVLPVAYRDPGAARTQLDQLRKSGDEGAAATLTACPELLGRLRDATGMFSSARTRDERREAESAAQGLASALLDLHRSRVRSETIARTILEKDERRACIEVPELSTKAILAIGRLRVAGVDEAALRGGSTSRPRTAEESARLERVADALSYIWNDHALSDGLDDFRRAAGDRFASGRVDFSDRRVQLAMSSGTPWRRRSASGTSSSWTFRRPGSLPGPSVRLPRIGRERRRGPSRHRKRNPSCGPQLGHGATCRPARRWVEVSENQWR